jgi:Tol biopolymer transport system component
MTTNDAFERNLSIWLHEDAEHHVPEHLGEVLQRTAATRQRAAWSSLERWLPMDTTFRRSVFTRPTPVRQFALLLLIALLIAALVALAVGSRQPRLPEPFGLARNGTFVTSRDGDIYLIDPATTESRLIIGGPGFDFGPAFSRDGTKMLFLRSDGPITEPAILTLYVANADGSDARPVTPPTKSLDWFDWSPDGTRIAYMATGDLWVVDVATAQPRQLPTSGHIHFPTFLPPDGNEILYRRETISPAIFAIAADGTGAPRRLSTTAANNEFDFQGIVVSPDGSKVTFTRWDSDVPDAGTAGWLPRLFALDVETGNEIQFPTADGTGQSGGVFSPDGKLIAYARIYRQGAFQIVVADADGSGNERTVGPKKPGLPDGSSVDASWAFAPDGTALIVRYGNDEDGRTQLLPLDGSPATDLGSGGFQFVDIQRLAP